MVGQSMPGALRHVQPGLKPHPNTARTVESLRPNMGAQITPGTVKVIGATEETQVTLPGALPLLEGIRKGLMEDAVFDLDLTGRRACI